MKKNFTLLELIVATFLIALIVDAVLHFYTQNYVNENQIKQVRTICIEQEITKRRLQSVFASLSSPVKSEKINQYIFLFNNHIDPNPLLSNKINAKLFINDKHQLILHTVNPQTQTNHEEILMHKVDALKIYYFSSKEKNKEGKIFKISITSNNKDFSFVCFPTRKETISL